MIDYSNAHALIDFVERSGARTGLLDPSSAKSDLEADRENNALVFRTTVRGFESFGRLAVTVPLKSAWVMRGGRIREDFIPAAAGLILDAVKGIVDAQRSAAAEN